MPTSTRRGKGWEQLLVFKHLGLKILIDTEPQCKNKIKSIVYITVMFIAFYLLFTKTELHLFKILLVDQKDQTKAADEKGTDFLLQNLADLQELSHADQRSYMKAENE